MKHLLTLLTISLTAMLFISCNEAEADKDRSKPNNNIVEVTARGMTFEAPDTIASGWTTFRFINESPMVHFFIIEKLPPGKTLEDLETEMLPVFQEMVYAQKEGRDITPILNKIPAWFSKIVRGGPGLTAPEHTVTTTLKMKPGRYVIECYLKTNGIIHSYLGMVKKLTVTQASNNATPPEADIRVTISGNEGITFNDQIKAGTHTFAVYFKDQKKHENFVGHDLHLARLDADTDMDKLAHWMNFMNVGAFKTPAPAEFLGGTQEMAAGETAYFTATLEPGRYALISEVSNPEEKGMLKIFTVSYDNY